MKTSRLGGIGLLLGVFLSLVLPLSGQQNQATPNHQLTTEIHKLFTAEMKDEASSNAVQARIRQIFAEYGVPTNEMVGDEAVEEYVAMLSGEDVPFLERVLTEVKRAADAGEISENSYIYLRAQTRQKMVRKRFSRAPANPTLKKEIDSLFKADQAVRPAGNKPWDLKKLAATDRSDGDTAHAIFAKYGLPTFSLVGPEASQEFDDVIQHQPLAFQKMVLPQMRRMRRPAKLARKAMRCWSTA